MRQIAGHNLWLGNVGDLRQPALLHDNGIAAVIDLAANEPAATLPRELIYCRFPIVDGAGNPAWLLRAAIDTVAGLAKAKAPTLVCCSAGMSRSPAVLAAAIARLSNCSLNEALASIGTTGASDVSPALWADIHAALE